MFYWVLTGLLWGLLAYAGANGVMLIEGDVFRRVREQRSDRRRQLSVVARYGAAYTIITVPCTMLFISALLIVTEQFSNILISAAFSLWPLILPAFFKKFPPKYPLYQSTDSDLRGLEWLASMWEPYDAEHDHTLENGR